MENFNKNWLIILLISVVFFTLGFLVGRVTGGHQGMGGQGMNHMMMQHGDGMMRMHDGGQNVTVKIDTLVNDGKKMEIKVEKKVK